jgi:hypothetical protein
MSTATAPHVAADPAILSVGTLVELRVLRVQAHPEVPVPGRADRIDPDRTDPDRGAR